MRTNPNRQLPIATTVAELPLTALLSMVLTAFIIEFDNEFERLVPHWTTTSRKVEEPRLGTWLVSMAGWYYLHLLGQDGATTGELRDRARAPLLPLAGMERWGYVTFGPSPAHPDVKRSDWLVRPSIKGRVARELGDPLCTIIEERWRQRFSGGSAQTLRECLLKVVAKLDTELPDFLPVLGYGLFSETFHQKEKTKAKADLDRDTAFASSLPSLLMKALVTITTDFEKNWPIALPVSANVLRILSEKGVATRDLPRLSGVSKEAIGFAMSWLFKNKMIEYTVNSSEPRKKLVRLTEKGSLAQLACRERLNAVETDFKSRFSSEADMLTSTLQQTLLSRDENGSILGSGLIPQPGCWRASKQYLRQTLEMVRDPFAALPHYPMVLHRGGFPDGS